MFFEQTLIPLILTSGGMSWVSKPGCIGSLTCMLRGLHAMDSSDSPSATPADIMTVSMAVEPFCSTYLYLNNKI